MKYSTQLHEDYPTKEAIDKISVEQLKDMWINAPYGYFSFASTLATYFWDRLEPHFTKSDWKDFDKSYLPMLKEKNPIIHDVVDTLDKVKNKE